MKKSGLILSIVFMGVLLFACVPGTQQTASPSFDEAGTLQVTVSVLPQKWFVDRIGGGLVKTQTLVGTGDDPHSYEPSPAQMVALGESKIYFNIGIEFEDAWMDRLMSANKTMRIVDSSEGIQRIEMVGGHHHHDEDHDGHDVEHEHDADHEQEDETHAGLDPHVWFSSRNAEIIARNIAKALIETDPNNQDVYQNNLDTVLKDIETTDQEIQTLLKNLSRDHFMVVHPAWGYFAHEYGLSMIPVEIHGSEPGPEDMATILEYAKTYQASVLFVEKGTNMSLAQSVAKQAGIEKIVEWDPMAYAWIDNMMRLAQDLQEALK